MSRLAELEIDRYEWSRLQVMGGVADQVPTSLIKLIRSLDKEEAGNHYWEIENTVVVQGQLFEAAPAVVAVLLAALSEGVAFPILGWVLELLYQLVSGESDFEAATRGNASLGSVCRDKAREGLWLLYGLSRGAKGELVQSILEVIDLDKARLSALLH